jgi:hypothetical protein
VIAIYTETGCRSGRSPTSQSHTIKSGIKQKQAITSFAVLDDIRLLVRLLVMQVH